MKVIPVIDILNSIVVHAVRGRRKEYQPLKSILANSYDPLEVAKAFKTLGFDKLYLADLDAITGKDANFEVYSRIADETGLELWVDAGVTDIALARKVLESGASKVVIGTETLQSKNFVAQAVEALRKERVIVSLDLVGEQVKLKEGFDGSQSAICLLRYFKWAGVSEFIVLDLARVGSGEGLNTAFLKKILSDLHAGFYVGGGVRGIKDLLELRNLGVSGVLAATALHNGKISVEDLRQNGLI
jgi:phosphoribosylformimino-5-aminoimidazole carboxamide ribotide isomerase